MVQTEISFPALMRSPLADRGLGADMTNRTRDFGRNESQGWVGWEGKPALASVWWEKLDGAMP